MLIEFNINLLVHFYFACQEKCACNFPLKTEN